MAAHRRVYDSRHLQADGQEPGSAPEPSVIGYGLPLSFYSGLQVVSKVFLMILLPNTLWFRYRAIGRLSVHVSPKFRTKWPLEIRYLEWF